MRLRIVFLVLIALLSAEPRVAHAQARGTANPLLDDPEWLSRFWWLLPSRLALATPPPQHVSACENVVLRGAVRVPVRDVRWESVEGPLLSLDPRGRSSVAFRAPSVVTPTRLLLRLSATRADGSVLSETAEVFVEPAAPTPGLAAGMAPDCAPFRHGVASGDPEADGVVLWTRLTPEANGDSLAVRWELAEDALFRRVVARGTTEADAARDFTVHVDVGGLSPAKTYYYRFRSADGRSSALGRTRTAALGAAEHARFAVVSCSSIYSGFFNAYRRIARRPDLDLVIHLGDYLYDFVDADEQVRIPEPYPTEPGNLAQWRERHGYYLSDPDLRDARAMHPWFMVWDNHDVEAGAAPSYNGSVQAFRDWNPMRQPDPARPEIAYRSLHYGDLVDVVMMDTLLHRKESLVPGTQARSMLGAEQWAWLESELQASRATWRVLGNQRLFSTLRIDPRLVRLLDGSTRQVFDLGAWDGFPETRTQVLGLLAREGLGDNVVISGDSHIALAFDLVDDPTNAQSPYDPANGARSQGVELLPTSISRGNFDETLLGLGFDETAAAALSESIRKDTVGRNPHHRFSDLTRHGYGILDLTHERVGAEVWFVPILERTDDETLGVSLTLPRGANRWNRD